MLPNLLPSPPFSNFLHSLPQSSTSTALFVTLFFEWMDDCPAFDVILLNNIMDLHMLSFGTLVPEEPCYACFLQQGITFTEVWHIMRLFASTLIWYHTHKQSHVTYTRNKILTHPMNVTLKSPVMYSQQLFTFHGINNCWY